MAVPRTERLAEFPLVAGGHSVKMVWTEPGCSISDRPDEIG
ncbi:hypothetical protein [Nocardia sp. NPDC052112]